MIEAIDIAPTQQPPACHVPLKSPYPFFGGKSKVASLVWLRLGDVPNYVEPFFGSGAVLLPRPHPPKIETVNDLDGMICNFWRAVSAEPEQVAHWADQPVNECDLTARHIWLVNRKESLQERLEGDPDFYDAKISGWWVWGICCWIGGEFCSGNGPWNTKDGKIMKLAGPGVHRQRPHLGGAGMGMGVNRKLPRLGDAGTGVHRRLPHLGSAGMGVNRKRPRLGGPPGSDGMGICNSNIDIYEWFSRLSARLRRVRVCCGDWKRVMGPSVTIKHGVTGVFLDPPYSDLANRDPDIYSSEDLQVAHDVREWCLENGDNPLLRIALCGYDDLKMPDGWEIIRWKTQGGYGLQGNGQGRKNRTREVIWFSPYCLKEQQVSLF